LDNQLQPFLFQKARRLLPITVKSDSGLAEGEIWFVDGTELTFYCVEKLECASRYEMRADVKTLGRNVDLVVEVLDIMHGRDAGMPRGFLHRGEFIALDDDDEKRFLLRFFQLNPEHAPADLEITSAPKASPRADARAAVPTGERRRSSAVPARPVERSSDEPTPSRSDRRTRSSGGPRSVGSRAPSSTRSRTGREGGERRPTPGERRRMRAHARKSSGPPEPPLQRERRVIPEVAPGDPPSAMLQYAHREIIQADAVLRGDDLWLFVGLHPLLWEGQELSLWVQLPAGNVVQLRGEVIEVRPDHCVLVSRKLHASMRVNFAAALGL